jgi:chromosome segregation protein
VGVFVEKIELHGFKSFVNRTEIPLSRGVTAIVGPNGCGKSNISDAFRWVLGEQNVRTLRGERVQDVIFQGTRETKPMGMAEVTLTLQNEDGRLPVEYTHVGIARRIFRSGDSEFSINKISCRLKDIRDLFSGTGLGSHGYAVIERSMVDDVLSERDAARRFLFEEAAGIIRYKQRRKEAQRKLEGVEQDLIRIEDMIREIEREVRSLARQAGKVRRWRRVKDELDRLEVRVALERWRALRDRSRSSEEAHRAQEAKRQDLSSRLSVLDAQREAERQSMMSLEDSVEAARRQLQEAVDHLARSQEEIRVLTTRNEAWAEEEKDLQSRLGRYEARLEEVEREDQACARRLEDLRGRVEEARLRAEEAGRRRAEAEQALQDARRKAGDAQQTSLDLHSSHRETRQDLKTQGQRRLECAERLEGVRGHLETFAEREAKVERDLAEVGDRFEEIRQGIVDRLAERQGVVSELEELRERREALSEQRGQESQRRAALESRLGVLQEQHARHEGFDAAVRWILEERSSLPGVLGVVGEELRLRPGAETLGQAVLGDRVSWILVKDEETAIELIGRLREQGLGGVTFFPVAEAGVEAEAADPQIAGLFEAPGRTQPFVHYLAKITRAARTTMEARLADRDGGRRHVTPEGLVVDGDGAIHLTGGKTRETQILSREQELPALASSLEEVGARLAEVEADDRRLADREVELKDSIARREEELSRLEREKSERGEERSSLRTELAMLREEQTRLHQERETLEREIASLDEDLVRLEGEVSRTGERSVTAQQEFENLRGIAETEESTKDQRSRESTEREMEALRLENEEKESRTVQDALRREREEKTESIAEIRRRIEERTREAEEAAARVVEIRESLEGLHQTRRAREAHLAELREEHGRSQERISELEAELRGRRSSLDEIVQALHEEDVERVQARSEADQIRRTVLDTYRVDLETWAPPRPDEPGAELEALSDEERGTRIARLRDKIASMGNLNYLAEEEYQTQKDRLEFHRRQAEDLGKARADLLEVIRQINQTAGAMFQETFTQVQEKFQKVFGQLFPGGEASLRLEGEDPLEGDVEISARPRGKRLESIRLLSTGERSLTAIALLFSLYLIKPSPVCLLDEVDAPLDDANLDRFLEMIRGLSERTQFVMITHNKRTMQVAENLFGVTMEVPGVSKIVSVRLNEGGVELDAVATGGAALDGEPAGSV